MKETLLHGDCLEKLKEMEDNSIDSMVTDPPYGISFMGKKRDYDVPQKEVREECLRVLKPGGHALIACGTRTQHRMAVNLEDGGFEIRDIIAWVYGSGFPKSLNLGKSVDKLQGNEREVMGKTIYADGSKGRRTAKHFTGVDLGGSSVNTKGTSPHEGRGTALKPAMELRTLCRKPLSEKTIAKNVLKHGTGGINIDECRVGTTDKLGGGAEKRATFAGKEGWDRPRMHDKEKEKSHSDKIKHNVKHAEGLGRFPANLIHDGSDEVVGLFPDSKSGTVKGIYGHKEGFAKGEVYQEHKGSSGSAARFFYCSKASKSERNKGLEGQCTHPTVKPIKLMQYLCRLITPVGGTILDPYMGSGSTGIGAKLGGFDFIGIEREEEYMDIARARMKARG